MRRVGESGQVLPLVAICLAALMGFGGLAVDVGYWRYQQREQQSATDAAALGGAQQLVYSSCPNSSAATTAAKNDAANGGFTDGANNVTVTPHNPPLSGVFAGNNCAVSVTITTQHVASFFTRLFGKAGGITESTQAVAQVTADGSGCMFMLGTGSNTNFNGANVQAPKCSIYLNGSANFNGATVNATAIGEGNYAGSNNGGTFTAASPGPAPPVADPCPEIAPCAALTNSPPPTSPCNGSYSGNGMLSGGCYSNLNLHGATVTLSGGTYVFAGNANVNGATIAGSGVTIYIPAGASVNWNKVNSLTLSPPTTGSYAGVSYYQVSGNSSTVNFNQSSTNVSGMIYAPSAQLNYNGAQGKYTVVVAAYANFNASSTENYSAPPAGQSLLKNTVLSQ